MKDNTILIIGAGLTGLSAGYHLKKLKKDFIIFEKESETGGLCRSVKKYGFTFDYTGHFLHFRNGYAKKLVFELLSGKVLKIKRKAKVFLLNKYIDYPFQANFRQLKNKKIIAECENGLLNRKPGFNSNDFKSWIKANYGSGISKYFMLPYNQKLWQYGLDTIMPLGTSSYIPDTNKKKNVYGYNSVFYYPLKEGIGVLPGAFTEKIKENIYLNCGINEINAKKRTVEIAGLGRYKYNKLISTIPLPELILKIKDVPDKVRKAALELKYVSLFALNLGVKRPGISKAHWIYFPEKKFAYYRTGFYSNVSKTLALKGVSSLYSEITYIPEKGIDKVKAKEHIKEGLVKAGLLRKTDKIIAEYPMDIKYAYAVFDINYRKNTGIIFKYLNSFDILTAGRYGKWEYSAMEDAILEGKETAELT